MRKAAEALHADSAALAFRHTSLDGRGGGLDRALLPSILDSAMSRFDMEEFNMETT